MPARNQLQREIDRRQAGADEQDLGVGRNVGERPGRPRQVGVAPPAVEFDEIDPRDRVLAGQVADRQHDAIGRERAAVEQAHDGPAAGVVQVDGFPGDFLAHHAVRRGAARGLVGVAHVVAEEMARHEVARAGVRGNSRTRREPAQEAARVVGKRAHAAGRNVEPVRGIAGAVRHAAAEFAPPLDERDAEGRRRAPQQVGRDETSRGAAAENEHRGRGGLGRVRHARAISPGAEVAAGKADGRRIRCCTPRAARARCGRAAARSRRR